MVMCLAMWVRDKYFPPEYVRATWQRLAPFFRLAGCIAGGGEPLAVELRGFNDRQLNRDLATVSALVARFCCSGVGITGGHAKSGCRLVSGDVT